MQVQTSHSFNPHSSFAISGSTNVSASQVESAGESKPESQEFKTISSKAAMLLSNTDISSSERARILNLLARARVADTNGATGELKAISNEMRSLDPTIAVPGGLSPKEEPRPHVPANGRTEGKVSYQDQSSDVGVSFSYPVAMNQYQAPLAIRAHEREHVRLAQAEALINGENVTTYVSVHSGYDGKGRLITTGGTTTVITHPKREIGPIKTGNHVDLVA